MDQTPDFLHLRISGYPAYVSRVLDFQGEGIVVRCPVEDGIPIGPAPGTPVDIGWMSPSGVVWHAGVATESQARDDSWTFRIQMLDGTVPVERRSHPRAQVRLDAELVPAPGAPAVRVTVLDIGAGGMRVRVPDPLAVGDVVQVAILPPAVEPVRLTARVLRVDGDTCAFSYELFWSGSLERLVELAFENASGAQAA
jgi:hypothetical protein